MVERKSNGQFAPGVSGNPSGRPKEASHIRELARERTTAVIETLTEIMLDKDAPAASRVTAASVLADRGWGRAEQSVRQDTTLRTESPQAYKPDLDAILAQLRAEEAEKARENGTAQDAPAKNDSTGH